MKRFYQTVDLIEYASGWGVGLDERPLKTPAQRPLTVPAKQIALKVCAEWRQQKEHISALSMPLTRLVNTIIDAPPDARGATLDQIVHNAESDLVCYRAVEPEDLIFLQNKAWDPIVAWAQTRTGVSPQVTRGVVPVEQPPELALWLRKGLSAQSRFIVMSLSSLMGLLHSVLLGMAVWHNVVDFEEAWTAAHVDEDWNIAHWGQDEEARERRRRRYEDAKAAVFVLRQLTAGSDNLRERLRHEQTL